MKILTKEEEQAHYNATLKGGIGGGLVGSAVGFAGVYGATRRYPAFRSLTLPLKAFLVTSAGTFAAIIAADKYSRSFEASRHPDIGYQDGAEKARLDAEANKTTSQRALDWGRENRYPLVGASWVASLGAALAIVGRNGYLTTAQKLVQARVYAQGLTLAVLVATAAFELGDRKKEEGRWETVRIVDPEDPTHRHWIEKRVHKESYSGEDLWRDMVETEERKMKERESAVHEHEERAKRAKQDRHVKKEEHGDEEKRKEHRASPAGKEGSKK